MLHAGCHPKLISGSKTVLLGVEKDATSKDHDASLKSAGVQEQVGLGKCPVSLVMAFRVNVDWACHENR